MRLRRGVQAVVHPRERLGSDLMPRVRLRRKLQVREVTRELQPSRTRSLGNERRLPLDAAIPLSTVDRLILHRHPKLCQQLPKVGIGKFVAVVEACDLQPSVNDCSALDGSVPRSKGLAQGISMQYRAPPANVKNGPARSTKTRFISLSALRVVSLGTARLIAFDSPQPSQYPRTPVTLMPLCLAVSHALSSLVWPREKCRSSQFMLRGGPGRIIAATIAGGSALLCFTRVAAM